MMSSSSAPSTIRLENYEQEFIGPFIEAFIGLILAFVGYYCHQHWERLPEVGLFESVALAISLAFICIVLLYLPQILYRIFSNKLYASLMIVFLFLAFFVLSRPAWNLFVYLNGTSITVSSDSEESMKIEKILEQIAKFDEVEVKHNKEQTPEGVSSPVMHDPSSSDPPIQRTHIPLSNADESADSENKVEYFDGDCMKHSKYLLSGALTNPKKYHVKGQVEMFKRTIYLTGKPSNLVLLGVPSEYEGNALDMMNRHHNAEAYSQLSVKDAVEKSLIKMCETLRREGFHLHDN